MDQAATGGADTGRIHRRIAQHVHDLRNRPNMDVDAVVTDLVETAASSIPGAQYAGITVVHKRTHVRTQAATHRYPVVLDDIQGRHLQGPCVSAQWEHHTVRIPDLTTEIRWPKYCRDALQATPVRSIMSFELFTGGEMLGALNVYADQSNAFTGETEEVGLVLATHAALTWDAIRKEHQFASALASRDMIGQAKGMIMERYRINAVQAFEILKRLSQDSNTPLAQIAQRVVASDSDGTLV
jgi:AmiR/NasT family two-component response regulator